MTNHIQQYRKLYVLGFPPLACANLWAAKLIGDVVLPHPRRAQTLQMPDSKDKFTRCLNFSFRINPALKLAVPAFNSQTFLLKQ
jgi:hypothetical protein